MNRYLLFLFFSMFSMVSYSTHILGGDMKYECIGFDATTNTNIYRIWVEYYIECDNGSLENVPSGFLISYSLDQPLNYGATSSYTTIIMDTLNLRDTLNLIDYSIELDSSTFIDLASLQPDPCINIPEICIEKGYYEDTINIPKLNDTIFICVRANALSFSILNIATTPGNNETVLYATIPPSSINPCAKGIEFIEPPKTLLCLGLRQSIDYQVTDIGQAYNTFEFIQPYSATSIGNPYTTGSFTYVVPTIFSPPYSFDDPFNLGDSVWINQATGTISIRPDNLGFYYFDILVSAYNADGELMSSLNRPFAYYVTDCNFATASPTIAEPECGEKMVSFEAYTSAGTTYYWDFGDGLSSTLPDIIHNYSSYGIYNGFHIINNGGNCRDTSYFKIELAPSYLVNLSVDKNIQCIEGNAFEFSINYSDIDSFTPNSTMYFGTDANLISSSLNKQSGVVFNSVGHHQIYLETELNGCQEKDTISINVIASPVADFEVSPLEVKIDESFTVSNLATTYDSIFYIFNGDTIFSENFDKSVSDLKEGKYTITQFVKLKDNNLCFDQKQITIFVTDYYWIKFPNTITPNGDGVNEYLFATHRNVKEIKYTIANRWGEIIYQDSEMKLDNKWFGNKNNGQKVATGVYVLMADYFDYKGRTHRYKGIINVIY